MLEYFSSPPPAGTPIWRIYLELPSPEALVPGKPSTLLPRLECVNPCPPDFYLRLYRGVGEGHSWVDRLAWTEPELAAHLSRREVSVWVAWVGDMPAGYFELERHGEATAPARRGIEVAYFGLMPQFVGQGLGSWMLENAARRAWDEAPSRVWLHTCALDHPHALRNYLRRGFREFDRETYPFPGAPFPAAADASS